jgi:hypothetical protein
MEERADVDDAAEVAKICREAVEKRFGFAVPATAMSTKDFVSTVEHAPDWWGRGGAAGVTTRSSWCRPLGRRISSRRWDL